MGFWGDEAALKLEGKEKVDLDVRGCENVLQALAVHPDYLLRAEVLEYMREKWYTLSDRAHCFVVAGLLRDRLFEQALEMLDDMCRKKVRVDDWVWSEAMWLLLEFGEVEEAFYVLGLKESVSEGTPGAAYGVKLSNALWGALLDAAAQQQLVRLSHSFSIASLTHSARRRAHSMDYTSPARLPQTPHRYLPAGPLPRLAPRRHRARNRRIPDPDLARNNLHNAPLRTPDRDLPRRLRSQRRPERNPDHGRRKPESRLRNLPPSIPVPAFRAPAASSKGYK